MKLFPAERTILLLSAALSLACAFLMWWKNITLNPDDYLYSFTFGGVLIALGQFYRIVRPDERISLMAHATALFVVYSVPCSLFNIMLLPRPGAPIDAMLVHMDAWFGYSWPALCAWIAQYPVAADVLRVVYLMTLPELLFIFMFLGIAVDRRRLHIAALATVLGSLFVIFCWALFPSSGASAYWSLDPHINAIVRPVVNSAYGAELNRLLVSGVHDVSALNATGLIGFPSFHTVLALVSLLAVWPYKAVRWFVLALSTLLFPAILIHGGHNLMDVFAGAVICLICWRLAGIIFDAYERVEPRLSHNAARIAPAAVRNLQSPDSFAKNPV